MNSIEGTIFRNGTNEVKLDKKTILITSPLTGPFDPNISNYQNGYQDEFPPQISMESYRLGYSPDYANIELKPENKNYFSTLWNKVRESLFKKH
jgi:hypothetical protein